MKVISIGTDRKIFEEGSAVRARMVEYAALFEELHLVVFSRNLQLKAKSFQLTPNCRVYPTNSSSRWFYIFDAIRIGKYIFSNPISRDNAVWVIDAQDPFECGLAAYRLSVWLKVPLCLQIHVDFLNRYFLNHSILNRVRVLIAKYILPKANGIRVVSQRIKNSLAISGLKLKVDPIILPVFVNLKKLIDGTPSFDLKKKYPQWDFVILTVARLAPEKNIGFALDVLYEVRRKYPKAGLVIVGNGSLLDSLKRKVCALKLQDNVSFEGWQDDLVSYYKTADLFLFTSFYEGFGLSLLEAVASGCPAVSSDVGIAPEILNFSDKSFVCPVNDLGCFTRKVIEFIEDNHLREFFKLALSSGAIDQFSFSKEDYLNKYREHLEIDRSRS